MLIPLPSGRIGDGTPDDIAPKYLLRQHAEAKMTYITLKCRKHLEKTPANVLHPCAGSCMSLFSTFPCFCCWLTTWPKYIQGAKNPSQSEHIPFLYGWSTNPIPSKSAWQNQRPRWFRFYFSWRKMSLHPSWGSTMEASASYQWLFLKSFRAHQTRTQTAAWSSIILCFWGSCDTRGVSEVHVMEKWSWISDQKTQTLFQCLRSSLHPSWGSTMEASASYQWLFLLQGPPNQNPDSRLEQHLPLWLQVLHEMTMVIEAICITPRTNHQPIAFPNLILDVFQSYLKCPVALSHDTTPGVLQQSSQYSVKSLRYPMPSTNIPEPIKWPRGTPEAAVFELLAPLISLQQGRHMFKPGSFMDLCYIGLFPISHSI